MKRQRFADFPKRRLFVQFPQTDLTGGSYLELMKAWRVPVYYDQQGALVKRFGIRQVPALEHALAAPTKVTKKVHYPALPVSAIGAFMKRLREEQDDTGAKALEFAILTAARDGEVRGAVWSEMDLEAAIWTVPAVRMKADREHRVPLSKGALALLKGLPRLKDVDLVFPGNSKTGMLSENTLNQVIKRMHQAEAIPSDTPGRPAVVHGMRSTFRNWGRDKTDYRPELMELSLAHSVGTAVEQGLCAGHGARTAAGNHGGLGDVRGAVG